MHHSFPTRPSSDLPRILRTASWSSLSSLVMAASSPRAHPCPVSRRAAGAWRSVERGAAGLAGIAGPKDGRGDAQSSAMGPGFGRAGASSGKAYSAGSVLAPPPALAGAGLPRPSRLEDNGMNPDTKKLRPIWETTTNQIGRAHV